MSVTKNINDSSLQSAIFRHRVVKPQELVEPFLYLQAQENSKSQTTTVCASLLEGLREGEFPELWGGIAETRNEGKETIVV